MSGEATISYIRNSSFKEVHVVCLPDADRLYVWHEMTPEQYKAFSEQGGTITRVVIVSRAKTTSDVTFVVEEGTIVDFAEGDLSTASLKVTKKP